MKKRNMKKETALSFTFIVEEVNCFEEHGFISDLDGVIFWRIHPPEISTQPYCVQQKTAQPHYLQ